MKKQNTKTVTGSYRHFKRQPDGSLKFVGVVTYDRPVGDNEQFEIDTPKHKAFLAWRNEDDIERHEADCAAFEDLADMASESEG